MKRQTRSTGTLYNVETNLDGYRFDSKLEASVYQLLKLREKSGELKIKQHQKHIYLSEARVIYIPDFECVDVASGAIFYVEAKGFESPRWPTVKKLWKFFGPGRLEIWKGTYKNPKLVETIIPKTESDACMMCGRRKESGYVIPR